MRNRTIVGVATVLLFKLVVLQAAVGQQDSSDAHPILVNLQKLHAEDGNVFVLQSDLDPVIREGGGGACASAAAIDAVQALRQMAGKPVLGNPHLCALRAIKHQPELLNGRVSNSQFAALLHYYASQYLQEQPLVVEVSPSPYGPSTPLGTAWSVKDGPDLTAALHCLRIVTFAVTDVSGQLLGRHFVLLKSNVDEQIAVVDPTRPTKNIGYSIVRREHSDGTTRVFLQPPPQVGTTSTLEVDAIFTLRLEAKASTDAAPTTIDNIRARVDGTAEQLREQGKLRSPRKWRSLTASYGLPGIDLPTDVGGLNWNTAQTLEVFMHAGRHDLNCRDVIGGAHARPLLKSSHEKVRSIVRDVALGKAYMAITITEPTAGSDFLAIKSTAKQVDGGFILSGEKRYVARLEQATHAVVFTQPASGKPSGLSAFIVPLDTPGLEIYSFGAHGLKGNSFGGMKLNNVRVESWQMIGADGEGRDIFLDHFRYWRLMQAAAALGTAERALEMMVDRMLEREAFGAPIGRFSHLQQQVGQHTIELRMAKALAREAAEMLDRGEGRAADPIINGLKAEGVEIALATVDSATRAFGAEGYSDRVDLGDRLQDLNGLRIADGTTDVMRMSVVKLSYGAKGQRLWELGVEGKK